MIAASIVIGVLDAPDATRGIVAWVSPTGAEPIHVSFWLLAFGVMWTA